MPLQQAGNNRLLIGAKAVESENTVKGGVYIFLYSQINL
jgi:hypothetical protein